MEGITGVSMFYQTWGSGRPVVALHPLALESTVFAGVASLLAEHGMRTLAVDMPGFGRSPAGNEPLTPGRLALPIIELARGLESPPILLGISLGARVAIEAALTAPDAIRGVALVVPYLPWNTNRWVMSAGYLFSPAVAERIPLELMWPTLKRLTARLDRAEHLQNDWVARACVRVAYNLSCPATRRHFISATRELMLDPAAGPHGLWQRLETLQVPATFVWGARDRLIPRTHAGRLSERVPDALQLRIACCGHFMNGEHYECFNHAMLEAVLSVAHDRAAHVPQGTRILGCLARTALPAKEPTSIDSGIGVAAPTVEDGPERSPENEAPATMRRLTGEDMLFVAGETPTMPMHTIGTLILDPSTVRDGGFDFDRVVRAIAARVHLMPPYRQRLIEVPLGLDRPVFVDDPEFRIHNHVHYLGLDWPATLGDLADEVARIASQPLDRSCPLWEMWYVDGLQRGRVALVMKMHHCLLDGASGASQLASLLDLEPQPVNATPPPPWRPAPLPSRLGLAARALIPHLPSPLSMASLVADTATGIYQRATARRQRSSTWGALTSFFRGAPRTRFTGAITARRSVAFASASLDDMKLVKNAFGATVNDVVLAACTLALGRYLRNAGDEPSESLLCAVPVSIKSEAEKREFSNKVATMTVRLPTDLPETADIEQLLYIVHEETAAAKRDFFATDSDVLIGWLDLAWAPAVQLGARAFSALRLANWVPSMANLVVSNMPGPPVPLFMAGARVTAIYPMGPIGEGTGLNITVLSNMDRLDVGLLACADTLPDIWRIADGFEDAVAELTAAAKERAAA